MPSRKKPTTKTKEPLRLSPENPAAKMWLWIGVSSVGTIILVLWLWATSISLSSFSWAKTPEKRLMDSSRQDWDSLFNDPASKAKDEQTKLQIKKVLSTIIAAENASSSTTSTAAAATTTIPTVTASSTITTTSQTKK